MEKQGPDLCSSIQCSGCGACAAACAFAAIAMTIDKNGFRYPQVNNTLCKNCGACIKVCHILHPADKHKIIGDVLAVWAKEDKFRLNSSSGGVASVFSDYTLSNDGYVTGVVWDENFQAVMKLLKTPTDIASCRGSKYVEVNTNEIFQAVSGELRKQKTILFIGLPCHVAAIKTFIPQSLHNNLITVEIICHGVPAQKSWKNYVDLLKKKYPSMVDFTFRKNDAWGYCETAVLADGTKIKEKQIYLSAFLRNFLTRESCFNCPYASKDRIADLTIGDFWYYPKPSNGGGVSYVSLNTETGLRLFEQVKERFIVKTDKWKNAARENGNLYRPSPRPGNKETAMRDWYNMTAEDFAEKYHLFPGFLEKIMSIPRRAVKKILKYIR